MQLSDYLAREKLSAPQFAERIGVTAEAVRLWTTGQRKPRETQLRVIYEKTAGEVRSSDFFGHEAAA